MKGEILLTDYGPIIDEATTTWMNGKREGLSLEEFTSRALCRAQVKRVVDEYEKVMQSVPFSNADIWGQSEEERAFWEALRAAGSE